MSIPEKAWPDGVLCHVAHHPGDEFPGGFIGVRHDKQSNHVERFEIFDDWAPNFDLPPGTITIRPDFALIAERDRLRAEASQLQSELEQVEKQRNFLRAELAQLSDYNEKMVDSYTSTINVLRDEVAELRKYKKLAEWRGEQLQAEIGRRMRAEREEGNEMR